MMFKYHMRFILYIFVVFGVSSSMAGAREEFFHAVGVDAANVVTGFLQQGLDPNLRDPEGQNALFLALRAESPRVVEVLLNHPTTRIDEANAHGETPLMMAALRGNLPVVRTLLARGARVQLVGWTPLHYAASGSSVEVLTLLLERGAAIDAPSPNGSTPLMMAARYGSIDAAELLLRRGADPRPRNQRGLTAADFATAAGREALAERLRPR